MALSIALRDASRQLRALIPTLYTIPGFCPTPRSQVGMPVPPMSYFASPPSPPTAKTPTAAFSAQSPAYRVDPVRSPVAQPLSSSSSSTSQAAVDGAVFAAAMSIPITSTLCVDPGRKLSRSQAVALSKLCLFEQYVRELQCVKLSGWKRKSQQAFLLNVYNAMVEHGIVRYGCPIVPDDVVAMRRAVVYRIGFLDFSLDTLYHVVFRANERPVSRVAVWMFSGSRGHV